MQQIGVVALFVRRCAEGLATVEGVVQRVQPEAPDIYARPQESRRDIYVLHARVRKGVSGGPVVDLRGRPLGVVFAASTVETTEGYALTNAEVRRALAETSGVVTDVLDRRSDVTLVDAAAALPQVRDAAASVPGTVQLWPHRHGTDAMFLALLRRSPG